MDLRAVIEVDLHNLNTEEAKKKIDRALDEAGGGVYRIRCIHGYHRGTRISSMIREEYSYGREPRVKRIINGSNEGITDQELRE